MIPDGVSSTCCARSTRRIIAIGCAGQAEQHLVVVDRQAVVGDELAVEPADDGRVRPDEADERLDLPAFRGSLRAHTTNCSAIRGG